MWIQPTRYGDAIVACLGVDELRPAFAGPASSREPSDVWFRDLIGDRRRPDLVRGLPPPVPVADDRRV